MQSFFVTWAPSQSDSFPLWEKPEMWQLLYNEEAGATITGLWTRVGDLGLGRCFQLVSSLLGCVCVWVCIFVCVTTCTCISVSVHVCASASHCWGPYLLWHGNYVCIFIFPALLVRYQTCPDSSCPPGRLGPHPHPTLCPMLPRYAPDTSQLVCRFCGAGRFLETDARATVGPCLRFCVIGQPWALTVTFTAGRDSMRECQQFSSSAHWISTFISISLLPFSQGHKL